ncbi:hypothetical protein, partial [Desulfovibrio piger]
MGGGGGVCKKTPHPPQKKKKTQNKEKKNIKILKNFEYAVNYQKKAIEVEFKYHKNIIKDCEEHKEIIKNFI